MNDAKPKLGCGFISAILFWVGTWVMMIPVPNSLAFFPKQVLGLWGVGYLMVPPYTKLGGPVDVFIAYHSFYIGLIFFLIASGIVILASGRNRRIKQIVAIVDALILVIWFVVSLP